MCDTEFESGETITFGELEKRIEAYDCKNIIWTGGEPASQITEEVVAYFHSKGYYQCIETSGLLAVPDTLDYIVVSPKVAEHVVSKNFPKGVTELRYVRHKGQSIPQPSVQAIHKYISPHSDGWDINAENLKHCVDLILENPEWKLSVQQHKLWNVL
jgi:organic radical activating enzyme